VSGLGQEWAERNCKVPLSKYCVDDGHGVLGCKPHLVSTGEGVRLQMCMGCERTLTGELRTTNLKCCPALPRQVQL
jgi:hypothetical protein